MFTWNYDLLASHWYQSRRVCDVIIISMRRHVTRLKAPSPWKNFSCVILLVLKIFARCKKHVSYYSSVYLQLIEIYLYTISLASKLLKCDDVFVIFDFLTNVKIDFRMSYRQKRPVKYFWSFETPLFILYKTLCPISSVYGPTLAYYK